VETSGCHYGASHPGIPQKLCARLSRFCVTAGLDDFVAWGLMNPALLRPDGSRQESLEVVDLIIPCRFRLLSSKSG